MGARMGRYETPLGYYFNQESAGVELKSCLFFTYHTTMNVMICAKAGAQHTCVKAVHSIKKLVVGLSYPMPLCYSAKAALSYIYK